MASESQGTRHKARPSAFTILEMAIVLAIIGVLMAGGMVVFSASLQKRELQETQKKLQVIQKTLLYYRIANNRIPCPSDLTLAYNNANMSPATDLNFGVEGANPGTCTASAGLFSNGNYVEGMVPTTTLRLPDDYAFDGWGRRITYAVDKRFTASGAFANIAATDVTPRMTVEDASDNAKTTMAAYVLVSFGPNGHGAYPRAGNTTRVNAGSNNADELTNCDCTNAGVSNGTLPAGTFVQKPNTQDPAHMSPIDPTYFFDDVVAYGTRSDLRTPTE